jgi:hypothetical protein
MDNRTRPPHFGDGDADITCDLDGFANFSAEHQHLAPEKMGGFRVRVGLRQKLPVPVTIRAIWAEIREEMLKMHAEFEKSGIFLGSCNRIDL